MKNKLIGTILLAITVFTSSKAQQTIGDHFYGQDAFLYSNWGITGSARMQGMGGSYTSLGADASNASSNPAGLGFYGRSEISFTPFYNSSSNTTNYQNSGTLLSNNNLSLGQAALILHFDGVGTRRKSSALAITYSKQAYLPTQISYNGSNIKSSMADYFAERANTTNTNAGSMNDLYDGSNGIFSSDINGNSIGYTTQMSAMAYQAYLIDPTTNNGSTYTRLEPALPKSQSGTIKSSGAVSQINISYGANFDDRLYIGGGIGIANLTYDANTSHSEYFANGIALNSFKFADALSVGGTGINLSLGGIFKASHNFQFGASIISPTWFSVSETYSMAVGIDPKTNSLIPADAAKSIRLDPSDFNYSISTPLRANFGATYLFGRSGFITADAEYVGYSMMRVTTVDDATFNANEKSGVQSTFNDVLNLKVGGEYRYDVWRLRAGVNYRPDPYKVVVNGQNHSQTFVTGGVGYRSSSFFIDLAGVFGQSYSSFTPYQLINNANYSTAQTNSKNTSIVLSVGTFF